MTTATDSAVAQFHEQGYAIFHGLIEPEVIRGVRADLESLVERIAQQRLAEGKITDLTREAPFETRMFRIFQGRMDEAPRDFRRELHLPGMFPLFFHPRILDLAESLLGPEVRLYPNYTVRPKLPDHEGTLVLWHQDGAYTHLRHRSQDGDVQELRMVNVWAPIVPARESNGCMRFVPGSHKLGVLPHAEKKYYLEITPEALAPLEARAVSIELDPGDVVLFHNMLMHCGLPNRAGTVRWSADWRYQDAGQSTLRPERGHIARSRAHPEREVKSAEEWARLKFE